ncbi:MAG: efflux RND transporter periplasmic adaptor subunit [Verrucomicrobia bacterium]|nr:efflux RND transporter periplasmic adaptor subunit [Verrucomicrobiota bacterium]
MTRLLRAGVPLAIGLTGFVPGLRAESAPKAPPAGKSTVGAPLKVTAVKLVATPLAEKILATGTLRADEGVELQPETNGKIVAINFTEGARVAKGDLLLKLNDAELQATVKRAQHRRELAELKERRFEQLLATKSISQQDYDAAASEVSMQRAEVALAEAQLAKMEIRAPFDGVVGLRFVSEGAFVTPTTRVATLQRLSQLKVDFSVPEKYATRIRAGSPVTFTIDGGGRTFKGEIFAIDPRIDSATRTALIRALCPNPEGRLLPGAFANVEFTLGEVADALLVPAAAVIPGLSEKNVFVIQDGKAVRKAVQTGVRTETSVQILSGLSVGDVVITSGQQQLRAGQAVVVDHPPSVAAAKPAGKAQIGDR